MKPVPDAEQTCKNCVHENDSGTEFCGCCGGDPPTAWNEDPNHVCERADKRIVALKEALHETLADLSSRESWCGGALSYTDEGDGMGCSPVCRHRKECAVLHGVKK